MHTFFHGTCHWEHHFQPLEIVLCFTVLKNEKKCNSDLGLCFSDESEMPSDVMLDFMIMKIVHLAKDYVTFRTRNLKENSMQIELSE